MTGECFLFGGPRHGQRVVLRDGQREFRVPVLRPMTAYFMPSMTDSEPSFEVAEYRHSGASLGGGIPVWTIDGQRPQSWRGLSVWEPRPVQWVEVCVSGLVTGREGLAWEVAERSLREQWRALSRAEIAVERLHIKAVESDPSATKYRCVARPWVRQ